MLNEYTHLQLEQMRERELTRRLEHRRRLEPQAPRRSWRTRTAHRLLWLADRLDDRASRTRPRLTSR